MRLMKLGRGGGSRPHLAFKLLQLYPFIGRMLVDAQHSTRSGPQDDELAPHLPNSTKVHCDNEGGSGERGQDMQAEFTCEA